MDEVLEQLGAAAIGENNAGDKSKSEFESLYKNRGRVGNQEERRKDILESQRSNRFNNLDKFRGILELVRAVEDSDFFHNQKVKAYYRPSIYVAGFTKVPNYCDVLMMSEWMFEKPADFAENWLAVPCPKGTRMMVLAHRGITKCYNKYGNFRFECRTALPGGNPCGEKKSSCVVLDCFYNKNEQTMYVLDILAWNDQIMADGEAAFRHFWISGYLTEIPGLTTITKKNTLIFKVIPKIACDNKSLSEFLSIFPYYPNNHPPVDGLLFYHKNAHYFAGETPVVNWLYPYMVNEVLGQDIEVHKGYMLEKPEDYTNYLTFIEKFEQRTNRIKQRKIFRPKDMDTSDISQDDANEAGPSNGDAASTQGDANQTEPSNDNENTTQAGGDNTSTQIIEETINGESKKDTAEEMEPDNDINKVEETKNDESNKGTEMDASEDQAKMEADTK